MTDPYPRISAKYEPLIRDALAVAWRAARQTGTLAEITEAIQTGGVTAVMRFLDTLEDDVARAVVPVLEDAISESGRALVEILPRGVTPVAFSLTEPNTAQYLREYTMSLIREIVDETREAVRQAVQAGVIAGRNPRSVAYDFRAAVGITSDQERTVQRFRQALIERDVSYIAGLRTSTDDMIRLADTGKLNQKNIDDAVNRLRLRYATNRAETIARTESMRAISIGQDQSIQQSGLIQDLEKSWAARSGDGRTREEHAVIDAMNGWIPYSEPFQTPLGPMMFPRDPDGTAENTINCRCRMRIRMRGQQ